MGFVRAGWCYVFIQFTEDIVTIMVKPLFLSTPTFPHRISLPVGGRWDMVKGSGVGEALGIVG